MNPYAAEHFLFDFDGTLVDSMPHWARGMLSVLDRRNIPYGDDFVNIITPLGLSGTVDYFIKYGVNATHDALKEEIYGILGPLYRDVIPAKDHVEQCLRAMKAQGKHLHVLTASPHPWLDPCLKRTGLWELFDNVWSCEDFPTVKTDPEIYRIAAQRLGTDIGNISFLDDNINADRAAMASGIGVIGVYDDTSKNAESEIAALCHGYIHDFAELKRFIELFGS